MDSPSSTSRSSSRRSDYDRWIIALLVLAALIPFIRAVFFPFVYDDRVIVRANPDIRGWSSLLTVWGKPYWHNAADAGLYRPVFVAMLAAIWNLGARLPIWFHLFAIGLHAVVTVLLWRMLRRAIAILPATLAALWFAVMPVHVEAVANVSNSSEVLVALLSCVLALYLARIDRRIPTDAVVTWGAAVSAGAIFLATFLSKESGIVAPFAAALWVWGWRPWTEPSPDDLTEIGRKFVARWWRVLVALTVAAMIVFAMRRIVLDGFTGAPIAPGFVGLSAWQRVWAMLSLGPLVARILLWPATINPEYGPTTLRHFGPSVPGILTITVILAMLAFAGRSARHGDRRPLAAICWFVITFALASNLLTATPQILTERTLYAPSIAVAFAFGYVLSRILSRASATRSALVDARRLTALAGAAATVVLILVTGLRTLEFSGVWGSNEAVFGQMVIADTASYRGYLMLARLAKEENRIDESLALFERAYQLYPRDRQMLADYAQTLLDHRQPLRAARVARGLLAWPEVRRMSNVMSLYLATLGQAFGADSVIRAGGELLANERLPVAALFVGAAHESRGDQATAEQSYRAGLRLAPADTALRHRLAVVQQRGVR